jgi:hypothetical protein
MNFREYLTEVKMAQLDSESVLTYEYNNGKKPKGRGSWVFSTSNNIKDGETFDDSYGAAVASARKYFGEKGHHTIYLLP